VLLITGTVSAKKADPASSCCCGLRAGRRARARAGKPVLSARYWVVLEEKCDTQVAFSVKIADYQWSCDHAADTSSPPPPVSTAPRPHRFSLRLRLAGPVQRNGAKKKKPISSGSPVREELSSLLPPAETATEVADEEQRPEEFNRVFLTYASDRDERFYGFGEQFSRMEFKGRRVPVLVQEQGIGRGDQPITFAANLVSYR
jgi:hypothetical protein